MNLGQLEEYTVFMTVGPSNCGKTYFCKLLSQLLESQGLDVAVISSDSLRRQLIGKDLDKYDNRMMEVSAQAFGLLYSLLRHYTSHPVNRKFIIIDSTGLNKRFRQDIQNICKDVNYKLSCVLFNYDKREDYFRFEGDNFVINKHVKVLKEKTCSEIRAYEYHKLYRVKEPVSDLTLTVETNTDNLVLINNNYVVVGDVHSCVQELSKMKEICEGKQLILIGDWIDSKLTDPAAAKEANAAIIDYLTDNPDILLIKGNHELNLYNKITKGEFVSNEHFSTRDLIKDNPEYIDKFLKLYESSWVNISGKGFVITHAPCKAKHLFKRRDKQINFFYPDTQEETLELLESYYKDYNNCWPTHLYGHIAFTDIVRMNNSICLDTGCGYGNQLTGFNLATRKYLRVASLQPDQKSKLYTFKRKVEIPRLNEDQDRMLKSFVRNQTPYISGTMSPSDKTETELESLAEAIKYYNDAGITKLCIQPKYMGNRSQVLLSLDQEAKVFSRNGFSVNPKDEERSNDLKLAISQMEESLQSCGFYDWIKEKYPDYNSILLDAELMPWSFLGLGLITKEFESYYESRKIHKTLMSEFGFYKDLEDLKASQIFKEDKSSKYNNIRPWKYVDDNNELESFKQELNKYSNLEPASFKVFNLLKVESADKVLYVEGDLPNIEVFNKLPTPIHEVETLEEALAVQQLYIDLEGIVVKPSMYIKGVAPYLKVRNTEYLRLIYGHDYDKRLADMIEKKSIKNKLRISIKEWLLGLDLLNIHSNDMVLDNRDYTSKLIELMFVFEQEKGLDPRL